jgi:hypothetical protein
MGYIPRDMSIGYESAATGLSWQALQEALQMFFLIFLIFSEYPEAWG